MKKKQMITMGITVMAWLLLSTTQVQAALQANGGELAYRTIDGFMTEIRTMQSAGGALGLTDTINYSSTNYDTTKPETCNLNSNNPNMDIHLQKNTEYGAMAILSASSYGNPNKIEDGGTTTGNKTGVVIKLNSEWTAAGQLEANQIFLNASKRYRDKYYVAYEEKAGDAVATVGGWHESGSTTWLVCHSRGMGNDDMGGYAKCGLLRSVAGSIFSYSGYAFTEDGRPGAAGSGALSWLGHTGRAVIVVGSGI